MSDANEIKLFIESKDMSGDIGIVSAVHDTYAGDSVDSIIMTLQDKDGTWSKWRPKSGERIELKLGTSRTGIMFIHKVRALNGIYQVTARAIPPLKNSVRKCEWEQITFLQVAQTIAERLSLNFENYGVSDQTYKRIAQRAESDTAFLHRLCHQESAEMLIFDGKLVVYDDKQLESQAPSKSYEFTGEGDFSFDRNEGNTVGTIKVIRSRERNDCGRLDGSVDKYDLDEEILCEGEASIGEGRTVTYTNLLPNDEQECIRWAQGLLRNANKYNATGKYKLSLQLDLAAGSVIQITNSRASEWNGSVFLYRVKHDYGQQISTLYFRKPLDIGKVSTSSSSADSLGANSQEPNNPDNPSDPNNPSNPDNPNSPNNPSGGGCTCRELTQTEMDEILGTTGGADYPTLESMGFYRIRELSEAELLEILKGGDQR